MGKKIKYYTPTIEEFHVGFEYEWKELGDATWRKENSPTEITIEGYEEQEYGVRVKYLDKEDIESLGFHTEDNGECYNKSIGWMNIGIFPWEELDNTPNEYKITIDDNTIFHGIIQNKSELKVLLKQLNIK